MTDQDLQSEILINSEFQTNAESQTWAVRYGAEPIDLHLMGKKSWADEFLENDIGITAGVGSIFNHNYIEIGKLNANGDFETSRRVHGMGLEPDADRNLEMLGGGRLIGFAIGNHSSFQKDDLIQRDDPHATKPKQLQHADMGNYTKIVFTGSEREVLQLYGAMVKTTIEINNKDLDFGLLGGPNSNTFNAEMKEKVTQMAEHLGISDRLDSHDPSGWDIGSDPNALETENPVIIDLSGPTPVQDLRNHIDMLEKTAETQWRTIQKEGIGVDLQSNTQTNGL